MCLHVLAGGLYLLKGDLALRFLLLVVIHNLPINTTEVITEEVHSFRVGSRRSEERRVGREAAIE